MAKKKADTHKIIPPVGPEPAEEQEDSSDAPPRMTPTQAVTHIQNILVATFNQHITDHKEKFTQQINDHKQSTADLAKRLDAERERSAALERQLLDLSRRCERAESAAAACGPSACVGGVLGIIGGSLLSYAGAAPQPCRRFHGPSHRLRP